jgi:hypothetical protein
MSSDEFLKKAGCVMRVVCGKKWTDLNETKEDKIRFCGDCGKSVFYTQNSDELKFAASNGLCVYIDAESDLERSTLSDKFQQFEIKRERIRKIEAKALARLHSGPLMGSVIINDESDKK